MPPRAGNVSMCSDKLLELLGQNPFRPWPFDPELVPTDREWHFERGGGEQGSAKRIAAQLYSAGLSSGESLRSSDNDLGPRMGPRN